MFFGFFFTFKFPFPLNNFPVFFFQFPLFAAIFSYRESRRIRNCIFFFCAEYEQVFFVFFYLLFIKLVICSSALVYSYSTCKINKDKSQIVSLTKILDLVEKYLLKILKVSFLTFFMTKIRAYIWVLQRKEKKNRHFFSFKLIKKKGQG